MIGLVLLISGCTNNCDKLEKKIGILIKSKNYCDTDSDCRVNSYSCPFGCHSLINKNANLDDVNNKIKEYYNKCVSCKYVCNLSPDQEGIKCENNKCVIK